MIHANLLTRQWIADTAEGLRGGLDDALRARELLGALPGEAEVDAEAVQERLAGAIALLRRTLPELEHEEARATPSHLADLRRRVKGVAQRYEYALIEVERALVRHKGVAEILRYLALSRDAVRGAWR